MGNEDKMERLKGTFLILVGLGLAKWQIYDPLHAAEQHLQRVWTSSTLLALAIVFPLSGFCQLVFGPKAQIWMSDGLSMKDWKSTVRVGVLALIGISTYIFVQRKLYEQGYRR